MPLQLAEKYANLLELNLSDIDEFEARGKNPFAETYEVYKEHIEVISKEFLEGKKMVVIFFKDKSVLFISDNGQGVYRTDSENYLNVLLKLLKEVNKNIPAGDTNHVQ